MTEDRVALPPQRGGLILAVVVGVLMLAAFYLGKLSSRLSHVGPPATPFVENGAKKDVAVKQLAEAVKNKKWSDEEQAAFNRNLGPLSRETRKQLSLQLVGLLNSNQLVVEREPPPPDPPPCSCGSAVVPSAP